MYASVRPERLDDIEGTRIVAPSGERLFREAADHIQLSFERLGIEPSAGQEDLSDFGLSGPGEFPEGIRVDRNLPPPQHRASFLLADALESTHRLPGEGVIPGQEDHAHPIAAPFRQGESGFPARLPEQGVRNLDQQADAVSGGLVSADRAPVLQVHQDFHGVTDDPVVRLRVQACDEPHTATVVFKGRIIQALARRSVRIRVACMKFFSG